MYRWRRDQASPPASVPVHVPVQDRIRQVPEALLLTAGYYGSKAPLIRELISPRP